MPPFQGQHCVIAKHDGQRASLPDTVFDLLRDARVGGAFWAPPAPQDRPSGVLVRHNASDDLEGLAACIPPSERHTTTWVGPVRSNGLFQRVASPAFGALLNEADPWTSLSGANKLLVHGDDDWLAVARIIGIPVRILSAGSYGKPGDDGEALDRRIHDVLACSSYTNPFTGQPSDIAEIVAILALWRCLLDANRSIAAACGIAWWKRSEIDRFLSVPGKQVRFVSGTNRALRIAKRAGGAIAIWPSRVSPSLINKAQQQEIPLVRIEDGFVRSVGLGSNLVPPSSIVLDQRGIYFDPSMASDLEVCLATTQFGPDLLQRAEALRHTVVSAGISKYAAGTDALTPARQPGRRLVLVPAQVEDDLSVLAGGGGLHSNLDLLRRVREIEPDAEIWFRPHPDVDVGHRKGAVPDETVMQYADQIVRGGGIAQLLDVVDAVHVLTSLTGFEALMRGREIICHGTPFYAGWGLTRDLGLVPKQRGRKLSLDQLVAGVLILYPRYLDPVTGLPCPPEVLISRMAEARTPNRLGWLAPFRRWQGSLAKAFR
jgi:capsular polysaccharide export protein